MDNAEPHSMTFPMIDCIVADGHFALAQGMTVDDLREIFRCALANIEYHTKYGMPGPNQRRVTSSWFEPRRPPFHRA